MNKLTQRIAAPLALASLLFVGCGSDPDFDSCCECMLNTAPDGSATEDQSANCWADEGDGSSSDEVEICAQQSEVFAFTKDLFDDGVNISLEADGCRQVCYDACAAVDETVKWDTPVVSAGECTVVLDGADQEVTNVMASISPATQDPTIVEVRATTAAGDWIFTLNGIEEGAGSYTMEPRSDFGVSAPHIETGSTVVSGTYDVTAFDRINFDFTFTSVLDPGPMDVSGGCSVNFTVNDGEVSGWVGLDADDDGE
jgi:hypothetical protein